MRFLALFFACYLTLLGCLPCTDEEPCAEATHTAIIQAAHHDCGTSHGGIDLCSPLCQCHCCAGFALPTATAVAFVACPAKLRPVSGYALPEVPAVPARASVAPWQPPQGA